MSDDITNEVERYYDAVAQRELARLGAHRMEHAITWRALRHYLPVPPARIADIGGGPGRYAIDLATQGYDVTLVDLSAQALALAREVSAKAGATISRYVHANAVDLLALASESYDAVLLLGPLYHLVSFEQRHRAVSEARRLLHPGGVIFAAFITRYSPLRDAARRNRMLPAEDPEWINTILSSGEHRSRGTGRFTHAYLVEPAEVEPFMESSGFTPLAVMACEGIVSGIDEQINALNGKAWEAWVDLNERLARDPSIHGAADHLLYVGRKPAPG